MELLPDQAEKLRQFQEVTNLAEHVLAAARVESVRWNLEQAIESCLCGDGVLGPDVDLRKLPEFDEASVYEDEMEVVGILNNRRYH
ncbi:unnamed protein product [Angiostrongylus costaricensis]|uniref:Uncharacterized protein n=1 Tax=Angiostrongylus costaricensis TaxID=334426 RepID=A0A0R3PED3_ANGCS|nr:unnamed protein product [Angiostrongylus costaricensis]